MKNFFNFKYQIKSFGASVIETIKTYLVHLRNNVLALLNTIISKLGNVFDGFKPSKENKNESICVELTTHGTVDIQRLSKATSLISESDRNLLSKYAAMQQFFNKAQHADDDKLQAETQIFIQQEQDRKLFKTHRNWYGRFFAKCKYAKGKTMMQDLQSLIDTRITAKK